LLAVVGRASAKNVIAAKVDEWPSEIPTLKVLLVEDGAVNQRVALGFIKMHGHDTTVANNGREAVEACERETFDVVLMDLQMPEMDGFEATSLIRRREQSEGRRTPIIAMTAAAMKGDRERCMEAGMDGYISKPIAAQELFETLLRTACELRSNKETGSPTPEAEGPPAYEAAQPAAATAGDSDLSLFDPAAADERIPGGPEAVREMAHLLISECSRLLVEIEDAIRAGDAKRVRRGGHTLKGSAEVFAAQRVVELSRQLEEKGQREDLSNVEALFAELSAEVERLVQALQEWAESE
jgi:CheY-like chemotaxis protein